MKVILEFAQHSNCMLYIERKRGRSRSRRRGKEVEGEGGGRMRRKEEESEGAGTEGVGRFWRIRRNMKENME